MSSIHAPTAAPNRALRVQNGKTTSGIDAQRDHALSGFECRANTQRLNRAELVLTGLRLLVLRVLMIFPSVVRMRLCSNGNDNLAVVQK